MATEVIMPALGMAQDSGKIVRWLRLDGEEVKAGEPLLEIETDKSTEELAAPAGGELRILVEAGDDPVAIAKVIAVIGRADEVRALTPAAPAPAAALPSAAETASAQAVSSAPVTLAERPALAPMSPAARKLARELGLDVSGLPKDGKPLRRADVEAMARARPTPLPAAPLSAPSPALPPIQGDFQPYRGYGEAMATRTVRSWQAAPHFYLERRLAAEGLATWLKAARTRDAKITITDLLILAVARALSDFPELNAHPAPGGIQLVTGVHVGLAVSTDQGLVAPVIHRAETMGLQGISAERRRLVEAARAGALRRDDVEGGTFTISNLGMFGIDRFAPVLNLDQALLLAVGRIREEPAVRAGAVVPAQVMDATLACDHRVTEGASAARFLARFTEVVEEPLLLTVDR